MATQSARRLESLQATCETESEDSDVFTGSSDDESPDDEQTPERPTPEANVGTKRSDPSIAHKKNKYATSDSGYSSLTATTASSSQSKKAAEQPASKAERFITNIKKPFTKAPQAPPPPPEQRPAPSRRMSHRRETVARELRSVESREEAARISTASIRATTGRRPSASSTKAMPGGYPPSPTAPPALPQNPSAPRAIPRARASTTAQASGARPTSYHAASAPILYQMVPAPQQVQTQHLVLTPQQQQQQQYQQQQYYHNQAQMHTQPLQINTNAGAYYSGSYAYLNTPTAGSPYTPSNMYPPTSYQYQHQPQPHPQQAHPQYWPGTSNGYSGAIGDHFEAHNRRMSSSFTSGPQYGVPSQYQEPQPHHPPPISHTLRRMSQSVQPPQRPMFQPPPHSHTPFQDLVFDEDDDPDGYYEGFRHIMDREIMPPPPIRPASSHRPRLVHARTTSAAHPPAAANRLSRSSIEYVDQSPRKASFESSRPPSRPGMPARNSTSAAHGRQYGHVEPPSPVRTRRRPGSLYGHGELEPALEAAESYQHAKTGGYGPNVAIDDLPPLTRRPTKTSETGSKGSRGSGSRESADKPSKRTNRHSLDKSRLRESYAQDTGVTLAVGGVHLNLKEGSTMTIKQSNEAIREKPQALLPSSSSKPASAKPTRESSRVRPERPEVKRYISGSTSNRSGKERDREVEVTRKRRSSSLAPRIGRDNSERELLDSMRRLKMEEGSRGSRRSSRSGRGPIDG